MAKKKKTTKKTSSKTTTKSQLVIGADGKPTVGQVSFNNKGQVVSSSGGSSKAASPTTVTSPIQSNKTNYNNLVDVNGEVRDTVTNQRFSSPEQLAAALGTTKDKIQWGSIRQDSARPAELSPAIPGQSPSGSTTLTQIYNSRPDLQGLYNPDGSAKNPADARIAGIPTLQSWMVKYGSKEYPQADPRAESLANFFTPEQIANMPEDIKTSLAAFADVQNKNFELGMVDADINAKTWADAMKAAAQDPSIRDKYGDELRRSTEVLKKSIEAIGSSFTLQEDATLRAQEQERLRLSEMEAAAGRAYSGFREQAKDRLRKEQSDIIKSSRQQLQQSIQQATLPFESRYGSSALNKLKLPSISGVGYDPVGKLVGSYDQEKKDATKAVASDFYDAVNY